VAIIVPNPDFVKSWCAGLGMADKDLKEVMKMEEFKKEIMQQMKKKEDEVKVTGLEKVKRVHFHPDMFTVQNDLLTPTFKVKRNMAKKAFENEITEMYALGEVNRV
jgi:long-chain acyl-CoA synthetase